MIPDALLDAVIAEAARQEGVEPDGVRVLTVERRTWPNGALGCPRAGEMYIQVVQQGYRVVLAIGTQEPDYRITDDGTVRRCGRL